MPLPTVFMFSGQGSQYYHMGKTLYAQHPVFRYWMDKADSLAQIELGVSLLTILYDETRRKSDSFNRTIYTHPALVMIQYALAQMLIAEKILPDKVLGTSLGEVVAAAVSGVLSLNEAIQLAIIQAKALEQHCPAGGMLAVLTDISLYQKTPELNQELSLAADNFSTHFIVAESNKKIEDTASWLRQLRISIFQLPVSHGFHSPLIEPAKEESCQLLNSINQKPANIPLISCATTSEHHTMNNTHLWDAIREPILFRQTIQKLEQTGFYRYIDIGPTGTLATFTKYNLTAISQSKIITTLSPYNDESVMLDRLKNQLFI